MSKGFSFKNFSIKTKIFTLVVILNFVTTSIFAFYFYEEKREIIIPSLEQQSKITAFGANYLLKPYHDKIGRIGNISDEEYEAMLKELNNYAQTSSVTYIYSFMQKDGKIVYSSTSATEEEFAEGDFDSFAFEYLEASDELKAIFKDDKTDFIYERSEDRFGSFLSILVPFENNKGEKYVVGVDIEISYIKAMLNDAVYKAVVVGSILFIVSATLFILVINIFLKQIPVIKNGVVEFFKFVNKEIDDVKYIDISSNDELGEMAKVINKNILIAKENISKDNNLIDNINEVTTYISNGSFKYRVKFEAHSPSLNQARDVINQMLDNIENIISKVINIVDEYVNDNYEVIIEKKNYQDDFLSLTESINKLGSNISAEKLKSAYDSISIQKSSNYLRKFIEELLFSFENISKDINGIVNSLETNEKSYKKILTKVEVVNKENSYLFSILKQIEQMNESNRLNSLESENLIKDAVYSVNKIELNLASIIKEIAKEISNSNNFSEPLNLLEDKINENAELSKNSKKVASDLSNVANSIRDNISKSSFTGKDNINIMMQYVDR